jgi:hypothetical protein
MVERRGFLESLFDFSFRGSVTTNNRGFLYCTFWSD